VITHIMFRLAKIHTLAAPLHAAAGALASPAALQGSASSSSGLKQPQQQAIAVVASFHTALL
jgi:hypothetical protein